MPPSSVVIVWGERIDREGEGAARALLEVAAALDLAGKDGSGLLEVPELSNARGLREAGCLPDAGPGLTETAAGRGTEEIRAGLESGEIESLVLFGVDPLRDFPDTAAWKSALAAAKHLVVFSTFENATTQSGRRRLPARDACRERRHGHPSRGPPAARPSLGLSPRRDPPQLGSPRRAVPGSRPRHRRHLPADGFRGARQGGAHLLRHHRRRDRRPRHPLAGPPRRLHATGPGLVRAGRGPARRTLSAERLAAARSLTPQLAETRPTSRARRARSSSARIETCGSGASPSSIRRFDSLRRSSASRWRSRTSKRSG